MENKRDYALDVIRLISIFMVVVIHISNYYNRYLENIHTVSFAAATVYNSIARISVPLFFMISGSLMLGKDVPAEKLRKKVLHFVFILVVWSVIYLLFDLVYMDYEFTLREYLLIVFDPLKPHLWFMYAIIALYLIIPFARILVANMDEKQKRYFVILWLIFVGVIQIYRECIKLGGYDADLKFEVPLLQGSYYFGYFIIGYLMHEDIKKGKGLPIKWAVCILSISLCVVICATYISSMWRGTYFGAFQNYSNLFVITATLSIFDIITQKVHIKSAAWQKILKTLSPMLFGVYLIHIIFYDFLIRSMDICLVNALWGVPLFATGIFAISLLAVAIIEKIPIVKEIVR